MVKSDRQKEYQKYLHSDDWKSRSKVIRDNWGNQCAMCKCEDTLHLHHLNYDNLGKETSQDVILLCKGCHFDVHKGRLKIWFFNSEEAEVFQRIKHIVTDDRTSYLIYTVQR